MSAPAPAMPALTPEAIQMMLKSGKSKVEITKMLHERGIPAEKIKAVMESLDSAAAAAGTPMPQAPIEPMAEMAVKSGKTDAEIEEMMRANGAPEERVQLLLAAVKRIRAQ